MSSVVISGDTSGAITLAAPAVAGTNTINLPAAAGTVMVSGNMPAFSAYANANQSFTQNTYTKVLFQTEVFDTNNNFASSTFTPTVAGYYQVNAKVDPSASTLVTRASVSIYKNGSNYAFLQDFPTNVYGMSGSCLIYCNGSTDYLEVYVFVTGTTPTLTGNYLSTWFNGSLVRSA
jgi:hypothetical protein